MPENLAVALEQWSLALGPAHVTVDPAVLVECETATYATTPRVLALLYPASVEEVSACLRIATQHGISVYPISGGRNWGLGSSVPHVDSAVLDLSRLNRIPALDERFGTLTVEPGVTFRQVHDYLAARASAWFLPVIGGPAEASVLGNCAERGDGVGPSCDRLANLSGLEVVLPDGTILHTGYERFGATPLNRISSTPAGPVLDGLFTQSNYGVITRATLWLVPHPQHIQVITGRIALEGLAAFVDSLQSLILKLGNETCTFSLWNGHKIAARDRTTTPMDEAWFANGCLYAPSALMAAAQLELATGPFATLPEWQAFTEADTPGLRQQLSLFLGEPSNENLRSLYVRRPGPIPTAPLDPDRDRCGAIWLCPEVPFDGAMLAEVLQLCEHTLVQFGFPPILGVGATTPRTVRVFITVSYDRDVAGEDERAMRCHDQLHAALCEQGFFPFRLGHHSMRTATQAEAPVWHFLRQLKTAIDPVGILAPGRYV